MTSRNEFPISAGGSPNLYHCRAFLLLVLAMVWLPYAYATLEPLYVSVHADRTIDDSRIVVAIYGRVTRLNQSAVTLAAVSIQVNDPYGSSIHIAFVHSSSDGAYSDLFQLPSDRASGNYTIYVTASKPGFQDGYAKLTFLVGVPPFGVSVFPTSVAVTRGETATFRISLESRGESASPVHIEVVGLPTSVSYSLSSNNVTAPSSIILSVKVPNEVNTGSYVFTIIAKSAEGESKSNVEIIVGEANRLGYYLAAAFLVVVALLGILVYRRRMIRKKPSIPPPSSPEYLEGLPLSSSTLLALPDHLRKSAIIVCQLKDANAAEVAARSGRARAAESDYLNQLTRMGILKKKRKGRESYFSVE